MITFLDGPAADVALHLRRCPIFLRVVQSPSGKWDALDQLEDVARPREKIFLYVLLAQVIPCFMRPGGYCPIGRYRHLSDDQPQDAVMRDNAAWREWVKENRFRLTPDWVRVREPAGGAA